MLRPPGSSRELHTHAKILAGFDWISEQVGLEGGGEVYELIQESVNAVSPSWRVASLRTGDGLLYVALLMAPNVEIYRLAAFKREGTSVLPVWIRAGVAPEYALLANGKELVFIALDTSGRCMSLVHRFMQSPPNEPQECILQQLHGRRLRLYSATSPDIFQSCELPSVDGHVHFHQVVGRTITKSVRARRPAVFVGCEDECAVYAAYGSGTCLSVQRCEWLTGLRQEWSISGWGGGTCEQLRVYDGRLLAVCRDGRQVRLFSGELPDPMQQHEDPETSTLEVHEVECGPAERFDFSLNSANDADEFKGLMERPDGRFALLKISRGGGFVVLEPPEPTPQRGAGASPSAVVANSTFASHDMPVLVARDGQFIPSRWVMPECWEGGVVVVAVYGAYGLSLTAGRRDEFYQLVRAGVSCCLVDIRGSGGHGQDWRAQGVGAGKLKARDDVIDAVSVIDNLPYVSRVCLMGASAGALMAASAFVHRECNASALMTVNGWLRPERSVRRSDESEWLAPGDNLTKPGVLRSLSPLLSISRNLTGLRILSVAALGDSRVDPRESEVFVRETARRGAISSYLPLTNSSHLINGEGGALAFGRMSEFLAQIGGVGPATSNKS